MSEPIIEAEWNNTVEWRCPKCNHTGVLRYRAAAPEITDAMVELRERYVAYKVTVLEDTVDDTTASLERRDDALGWLLVAVDAALEARKEGE